MKCCNLCAYQSDLAPDVKSFEETSLKTLGSMTQKWRFHQGFFQMLGFKKKPTPPGFANIAGWKTQPFFRIGDWNNFNSWWISMLLMLGVNPGVICRGASKAPSFQPQNSAPNPASQGDPMAGSPRCIGFNLQLVKPNLCRNVGNLQFKMSVVGMDFPKTIKKQRIYNIYIYRYMYVYRNRCAKATFI